MAFDFPNAPALNAVYTSGGVTYVWNGQGWINQDPPVSRRQLAVRCHIAGCR